MTNKFLRMLQEHYRQAKGKECSQLLNHMERVTALKRKQRWLKACKPGQPG